LRVIPNLLSLTRLLVAPYLFWLLWRHSFHAALVVMFLAGLTDAFDGFLARRLNVSSRVGEVLDPIADKVLLTGAYLGLWLAGAISSWLTAIVLGRDVLILAAAGAALLFPSARGKSEAPRRFPPSLWGKLSTIAQMGFVVIVTASLDLLVPLSTWITAILTVWSFLHYAWLFAVRANQRPAGLAT
jgi:cardiolipin synthase (CMP-forming)